jgi:hypothetical protein
MSPAAVELITGLVSCVLTIMVLSYLIGDNPFFRVAIYLFIGFSAGYVTAVAWDQVIVPRLINPLLEGGEGVWLLAVPLVLSALLLMKISPRLSSLGSPSLGFMVGVGTAVAIGGAVLGTLIPQVQAAINPFDVQGAFDALALERLFEGSIMLVGTVSTLAFFHFGARQAPGAPVGRARWIEILAIIGRFFIAVTFGVLFAGAYAAALTALVSRLYFIWSFIVSLF